MYYCNPNSKLSTSNNDNDKIALNASSRHEILMSASIYIYWCPPRYWRPPKGPLQAVSVLAIARSVTPFPLYCIILTRRFAPLRTVNHNNTSHFVALFTGLPSSELAGVLGAAFSVPPSSIIGLLDSQTGFVIPLSLASLSPETLNGEGHSYSLLLQQSTAIANLPPSAPERDVVSTDMYNASFAPPSAPPPVYEPANQTRGNQVYWNEEEVRRRGCLLFYSAPLRRFSYFV